MFIFQGVRHQDMPLFLTIALKGQIPYNARNYIRNDVRIKNSNSRKITFLEKIQENLISGIPCPNWSHKIIRPSYPHPFVSGAKDLSSLLLSVFFILFLSLFPACF